MDQITQPGEKPNLKLKIHIFLNIVKVSRLYDHDHIVPSRPSLKMTSPIYKMFLNKPGFGAGFGTTGFGGAGGDSWKGTNKSEQSFFDFGNHYRLNENKKTSILTKAQDAVTG